MVGDERTYLEPDQCGACLLVGCKPSHLSHRFGAPLSSQVVQVFGKHANFKLEVAGARTISNVPNHSVEAPSCAMDETVKSHDTHSP